MAANSKPPKVFISYAWEDDIKTWVLDFATRLRSDGVNAILDQWETVPGDQLTEFMEKSVRESDFVVFVCTPTYKRKSDRRKGGVGYEGSIITGEVFAKNNHRKFIPVLRKGKWGSAAPSWATSKLFIDLRNDPYDEMYYQQLLNTLFRKSPTAPPVWDDTIREKAKREAEEKVAREKEQQETAEKAVREKEEFEKVKKAEREELERELAEKEAREKAEKAKREAAERVKRERAERRSAQIRGLKEIFSNSFTSFKLAVSKAKPLFRIVGIIGIILGLLWVSSWAVHQVLELFPNASITITSRPTNTTAPSSSPVPSTRVLESSQTPTELPTSTLTPLPTKITDAKGVLMVLVPAGAFRMGSDKGDADEKPVHSVYLDNYYIDMFEVTNSLYRKCADDGGCRELFDASSATRTLYYGNPEYGDFPVINLHISLARTYCEWRGARLPTEAEWEKASRGTDERSYPWGEGIDCGKSNYYDGEKYCVGDTSAVGSYPDGVSPFGVYDMAGNVSEWVEDGYLSTYYSTSVEYNPLVIFGSGRIIRGGSWMNFDYGLRTANRTKVFSTAGDFIGFRCAKDANP